MLSLFNICINPVNSKQEKKKIVYFDEIFSRNICKNKKCPYLCSRNRETYYSKLQKLFYGVMVTRQILVLKFQVRALVEQQKRFEIQFQTFFYFSLFIFFSPSEADAIQQLDAFAAEFTSSSQIAHSHPPGVKGFFFFTLGPSP